MPLDYTITAVQDKAVDESDAQIIRFLKRRETMLSEADGYVSSLQAANADLDSAKSAVDQMVAADPTNEALLTQQKRLEAKVAESEAIATASQNLRNAIDSVLNS